MEHSEQIGDIATALAVFQGKLKTVAKDREATVPTKSGKPYTYHYTDLASQWEAVREALAECCLALVQGHCVEWSDTHAMVYTSTTLVHQSGQWIQYPRLGLPVYPDKYERITAQAIGSACTYGKRYAMAPALGIATADDDGRESQGAAQEKPKPQPARKEQNPLAKELTRLTLILLNEHKATRQQIRTYLGRYFEDCGLEEIGLLKKAIANIENGETVESALTPQELKEAEDVFSTAKSDA